MSRYREERAAALLELLSARAVELTTPAVFDLDACPDLDALLWRTRDALRSARLLVAQLEDLEADTLNGIGALEEP